MAAMFTDIALFSLRLREEFGLSNPLLIETLIDISYFAQQ